MSMRLSRSIVGEAEAEAVRRVIVEDGYLGMGHETCLFEQELAAYLGVAPEQVVTTNTGTAALTLAVDAIAPRDAARKPQILVPSLTFVASFQAIEAAVCEPWPVTCWPRPAPSTSRTPPAASRPTRWPSCPSTTPATPGTWTRSMPSPKNTACASSKTPPMPSAACTTAARSAASGTWSVSALTASRTSPPAKAAAPSSSAAEAGYAADARLLSVEGDTRSRFAGTRTWDPDVKRIGWRFHMSNIMAAIGRVQLSRLDGEFIPARRALGDIYRQRLTGLDGLRLLQTDPQDFVVPHIVCVRVLNGRKDELKAALTAAGIPVGVHYKPNHLLSLFRPAPGSLPLPVTEQLYGELVTLPMHPGLSAADVEHICDVITATLA